MAEDVQGKSLHLDGPGFSCTAQGLGPVFKALGVVVGFGGQRFFRLRVWVFKGYDVDKMKTRHETDNGKM